MPLYEITVVTRPLAKLDLIPVLCRAASVLLDKGAIIANVQSLGHRDLPFRKSTLRTKDPVFTSNYFLLNSYMPVESMGMAKRVLRNDRDLVMVTAVNDNAHEQPPKECKLEELLKAPSYRKSVEELRSRQKLSHFTRAKIYKRSEKEWKAIPKSYPVAPHRD